MYRQLNMFVSLPVHVGFVPDQVPSVVHIACTSPAVAWYPVSQVYIIHSLELYVDFAGSIEA